MACLDFTHSLSDLCLALLVVLVAESWGNKILSPFICRSYHLFFMFFLRPGSQVFRPSRISLPLHNLKFSILSLCSCFCPPPSPQNVVASLLSLCPSLHPKINNLCTEACQLFVQKGFWMPFRPGSPRGGKLTNLVLFHNPFLCFSFFLVGATLIFFFLQALSRLHPSLKTDT